MSKIKSNRITKQIIKERLEKCIGEFNANLQSLRKSGLKATDPILYKEKRHEIFVKRSKEMQDIKRYGFANRIPVTMENSFYYIGNRNCKVSCSYGK